MRKLLLVFSLILCLLLAACNTPLNPPPVTPDTPVTPDVPDTPDTPSIPDTPDTPDTPSTPDAPDTPDTPVVPDEPKEPEVNIVESAPKYEDITGEHHMLYINEVCSSNNETLETITGLTCDYIEIYNSHSTALSLGGYTLTDRTDGKNIYTFPNVKIPGKSFLIVYASGGNIPMDEESLHAPFKLSSAGESLYFFNNTGTLIDTFTIPSLETDTVYSRIRDGETAATVMTPTPGKSNTKGEIIQVKEAVYVPTPTLSVTSGFYDGGKINISAADGLTVYYTLDCSVPTTESTQYKGGFTIDPNEVPDDGYTSRKEKHEKNDWAALRDAYETALKLGATNAKMQPYEEPDRVITLRVAAFDKDGNSSDVVSVTLLTDDQKGSGYNNMSILSIIVDPFDLYDYETGLFVKGKMYDDYLDSGVDLGVEGWLLPMNYYMSGYSWERDAHLDFFEVGGVHAFSQEIGVRNHGNSSRANDTRPLKFYARDEYDGNDTFIYDLFGNGKDFDAFIVRNGNSERGQSKIRDVFAQELAEEANLDVVTQDSRPCILFVNGEYWGPYSIQERLDKDYFTATYGIPSENVAMVKPLTYSGSTGNQAIGGGQVALDLFDELMEFMENEDFSLKSNFDKLCEMVDIESMVDYFAIQYCVGNVDFTQKNAAVWRSLIEGTHENEDTKWRWVLFDIDMSQGARSTCQPDKNYLNTARSIPYFRNVYDTSAMFRAMYKAKVTELMNTVCSKDYALAKLAEYRKIYGDAMAHFFEQMPTEVHRSPGDGVYKGDPITGAEEYDYAMKQLEDFYIRRGDFAVYALQ